MLNLIQVGSNAPNPIKIMPDKYTDDALIKYKVRSINLLKHNPNFFVNRSCASFVELLGGYQAVATILGFGAVGALYRFKANSLRQIGRREGLWFCFTYFLYGTTIGVVYSSLFFLKFQVFVNDYFANYLLKRYKPCAEIQRTNIYRLKDVENTDDEYRFTKTFMNSFHM